ncbi:hypothetical protein LKM00_21995 [Bacillus wiedmannii]|uniref:hypothetical protein n=1 Tax=Bacillus wiedmannii TaxID=1890302 RepID=UPI0001A04321|nr:hypothetical protein [Bacillus wiedmannii]EEK65202.1 hypothetical protein bcere0006_45720 [Bacillus wiedmannii]MCC2380097.1 hypothetical protein [Bacillus wiedmannii]MCC2424044.1 hypothetical protein [Bacillus wiedmannii]
MIKKIEYTALAVMPIGPVGPVGPVFPLEPLLRLPSQLKQLRGYMYVLLSIF